MEAGQSRNIGGRIFIIYKTEANSAQKVGKKYIKTLSDNQIITTIKK